MQSLKIMQKDKLIKEHKTIMMGLQVLLAPRYMLRMSDVVKCLFEVSSQSIKLCISLLFFTLNYF